MASAASSAEHVLSGAQKIGFRAQLENWAKAHQLALRLDDDLLDLECLEAMARVCPALDAQDKSHLEHTEIHDFKFSVDEMFPASAGAEFARHVEALRAAGFGVPACGSERKRKRASASANAELTEAERSFADFLATTMLRTGALGRLVMALDEIVRLERALSVAQRAIAKFGKRHGTTFDVEQC